MAKSKRLAALVQNVNLSGSHGSARLALSCEFEGARYHVWIDAATLELESNARLFKNPPLGVELYDEGHFRTRRLETQGALGRVLIPEMFERMRADGLVAALKARQDVEAASNEARSRQAAFARAVERAAPRLHSTLEQIVAKAASASAKGLCAELDEVASLARAALDEVSTASA